MTRKEKIYNKIMEGKSDNNISFEDFRYLIISLGFRERIRGDHHFMTFPSINERVNIQPQGNKAKAYQVKQVRYIIEKYELEV